jgi:hypothetical protein
MSKCQKITASNSAEAEIEATDQSFTFLELAQVLEFLNVRDIFMPATNNVN